MNLSHANLQGAVLDEANLNDTQLQGTNLRSASQVLASLQRADLEDANLENAKCTAADFRQSVMTAVNGRNSVFEGADLEGAHLTEAHLNGADRAEARRSGQQEGADRMDGCLICGVQHTGSCTPHHPEHRPLSAEEWAERDAAAQRNAEKEAPESPAPNAGGWQTFKERVAGWFSRGEEPAPSPTQKEQEPAAGQRARYDVETPGPTEAAGGSFQVFHSKAAAEQAAARLPPSQESQIDQAVTSNGPTDAYVLTSLPRPEDVAVDKRVEEQIQQLEDPRQRAEAERLMRIIREEPAPRQERQREQEAEMER